MNIAATIFYAATFLGLCVFVVGAAMAESVMWMFTLLLVPLGIWAAVDVWALWNDY